MHTLTRNDGRLVCCCCVAQGSYPTSGKAAKLRAVHSVESLASVASVASSATAHSPQSDYTQDDVFTPQGSFMTHLRTRHWCSCMPRIYLPLSHRMSRPLLAFLEVYSSLQLSLTYSSMRYLIVSPTPSCGSFHASLSSPPPKYNLYCHVVLI